MTTYRLTLLLLYLETKIKVWIYDTFDRNVFVCLRTYIHVSRNWRQGNSHRQHISYETIKFTHMYRIKFHEYINYQQWRVTHLNKNSGSSYNAAVQASWEYRETLSRWRGKSRHWRRSWTRHCPCWKRAYQLSVPGKCVTLPAGICNSVDTEKFPHLRASHFCGLHLTWRNIFHNPACVFIPSSLAELYACNMYRKFFLIL